MTINTEYISHCIRTLRTACDGLKRLEAGDVMYETYRAACVKEFELVLEQSGRLLKKKLRPYFASNRQADQLTFNDIFRHAAKHSLISGDECERWLEYRALRVTAKSLPKGVHDSAWRKVFLSPLLSSLYSLLAFGRSGLFGPPLCGGSAPATPPLLQPRVVASMWAIRNCRPVSPRASPKPPGRFRKCARREQDRRGHSHICPTFTAMSIESPLQK